MRISRGGKLIEVPDGSTVSDLKATMDPAVRDEDVLVVDSSGRARVAKPNEALREGAKYVSLPPIDKGSLPDRLEAEVELLRAAAGGKSPVKVGKKTIGATAYTGVKIDSVPVDLKKFGVARVSLLFLLPADYPRTPPIGCYINYRWPTGDKHFTLSGFHGAHTLKDQGWYWYCVGFGGYSNVHKKWKPSTVPEQGHNLATLFMAAQYAINQD